jgi:glycosyltransferase involved in cell wall biosynthesis
MRSNFFSWRRAPLRVGWISSWNAKCGIAEYSKFLLDHIDPEGIAWTILASRNDTPLSPDAANVVRCWTDCTQPATPLLDILDHEGFDVLVIQFNFGFLALADLQTLLARARVAGTRIILMFHATADADILGTTVSLASIANSLRGVDRIFVHGSEDVARLRGFGVIDNVALFPHGYFRSNPHDRLAARADLHLPPDDLILGSYGFLLPHKGIPQLIAATALLRADDVPARLLLVNALYPIAASAELLAACREQVADLGLQDLVHFDTRFLSNAESLRSLAACDLIVYA